MKTSMIAKSTTLAAFVLLAVSCGGGNKNQTVEQEEKKTLVKVATAVVENVAQTEEFTGSILPYSQNNISPSMGLRIDKIYVDVGDRVRKGQLLVEMDRSTYLQSQVQLENLKTDLERYETLYAQGGISKQQLDQMTTQVAASQHALDNLTENTRLTSPVDGLVTARSYDPGDVYGMGSAILTVMQIDRVKVQVNISETYFPQLKVGMPVEIKLDVYPGEAFEGKVSLIHPAIDASTRTFTAEITIQNGNLKLRPGMFARVSINFGDADRVIIPDISIQKQVGSNERFVFVIQNNKAIRRTVTAGRVLTNRVEVLSGVNEGDVVVVAGGQKLLDGTEVEVTKE